MITKAIVATCLAFAASLGTATWDKAPEKWNLSDVYRILQDSPWSPAAFKLEGKIAPRQVDSQTGLVTDSRSNPTDANPVPGVRVVANHNQPFPCFGGPRRQFALQNNAYASYIIPRCPRDLCRRKSYRIMS
jgi:hypothetical protein